MTLVVAHRGAAAVAPENTMPAFQLAAEGGADAIECDVHLTVDGQLAVIHDETLDRTTNKAGRIASLTMTAVRRADAGARFEAPDGSTPFRGKGLRVPSFGEILDWLPDGIGLVVEVKALAAVAPTIAALRDSRVRREGRAALLSFDEATIEEARAIDPSLPTGYLLVPMQPIEPALKWALERGHRGVYPWDGDLGMDPAPVLSQARAYGLEVGCYVVNDPERMLLLAAYGLSAFVTDDPALARATLGPKP